MHVNKVHHVTTITRVAEDLGEDEDWLRDIANEMDVEDGVIWVYGVGEDGVMAFTDFGIENLIELVRFYKQNPRLLSADQSACGLRRMDTQQQVIDGDHLMLESSNSPLRRYCSTTEPSVTSLAAASLHFRSAACCRNSMEAMTPTKNIAASHAAIRKGWNGHAASRPFVLRIACSAAQSNARRARRAQARLDRPRLIFTHQVIPFRESAARLCWTGKAKMYIP